MRRLDIDIETYSSYSLAKCGVYKYVESPDFQILLFGFSVDGGEVQVIDLAMGEELPSEIKDALMAENVIKTAHNANFERICLSRYLELPTGTYLDPASWHCTMVWSGYLGLPLSLKDVGAILKLDKTKMEEGKDLIRLFCVPDKDGRRQMPEDHRALWELFKNYNKRDVETEMEIMEKLSCFPVPDFVWEEYHISEEINDRGAMVDLTLVRYAIAMDIASKTELRSRMQRITDMENPNSVQQLKSWLKEAGYPMESLGKKEVAKMIHQVTGPVKEVLILRQQLAKSSVKKYQAMESSVCRDGRVRGMFQFYGATHTGRFASKIVQLQNLPQNHLPDLAEARELVRRGDLSMLKTLYENVPDTLSQLIRTTFIAKPEDLYYVADYSAIECRVLAWLAGEQWVLDSFAVGKDIYCVTAEKMFHVPVEKHGIHGELRQKGKQATLSCIAGGQMVLTDHGEKPIEDVLLTDQVWDGENWVYHDGVLYQGEREVITYQGLTATADHLVFIEELPWPVPFGPAAASGAHLKRIGKALKRDQPWEPQTLVTRVYDIQNAGPHHRYTVSGCLVHNCGYGGSTGALKAMGALEAGMTEEELKPLVDLWREANPHIVRFWWQVDKAAKKVIQEKTTVRMKNLIFSYQSGFLFITLPSGRRLAYARPRIGENKFGGKSITYEAVSGGKWTRLETYGATLTENIVQGVARDILCNALKNLRDKRICMHVHDELIIEGKEDLQEICDKMALLPEWGQGLILKAEGYVTPFYKKD